MMFDYPDERCVLPENADRLLFAEDFVNYILKKLNVPFQCRSGIADHRVYVYSAFNPEIEVAASYSCYSHTEDIEIEFEDISKQIALDSEAFLKYVADLSKFVSPYPMPERLMHFCVKISMMAGKFYRRGCLGAPFLAFQMIVNFLNFVNMDLEGYRDLNDTARSWSRYYVDLDLCNMTPDPSSDASNSPEHAMVGEEGQDHNSEELSDDGMYADADVSPPEEAVSSSSDSERIEKSCDAKSGIVVKSSGSTSDYSLSGSYAGKNSEDSSHSYEDTSSDEEFRQNKKPCCSNSKKFVSGSRTCEKDLNTVDCKDPSSGLLKDKH